MSALGTWVGLEVEGSMVLSRTGRLLSPLRSPEHCSQLSKKARTRKSHEVSRSLERKRVRKEITDDAVVPGKSGRTHTHITEAEG